ncbi:hypothetical protein RRG08_009728 [Elysia crispata]|uniref:Uncharacterized protein n=1 Tax=Elysia crispata TaxID=231223 RepID=A0AAE0Y8Y7_9GAST|nr:hypothetical protein RRG08_009728 [Elysia crispata]
MVFIPWPFWEWEMEILNEARADSSQGYFWLRVASFWPVSSISMKLGPEDGVEEREKRVAGLALLTIAGQRRD